MEEHPRLRSLRNLIDSVIAMRIPVYAAYACYFLALAVFPALLLILASLRYTPLSAIDLIELLEQILPGALMPAAESLIVSTYYNSSTAVVSVSALTALWSASRGIHGLLTGLNNIYGVQEDRGYVCTRIISAGYMFVFLVVLILTLVIQVFGQSLSDRIWAIEHPLVQLLVQIIDWRSVWLLVVQVLVFAAIYTVLPNRRNRFWESLPGAVVAAFGWQGFSNAFSWYVEEILGTYTNIYGSIYTVALGLLWIYCCMSILLFGGVVNRLLQPKYET